MTDHVRRQRGLRAALVLALLSGCTNGPATPDEVEGTSAATTPTGVVQLTASDEASDLVNWDLAGTVNQIFTELHASIPGPQVRVLVHAIPDLELPHGVAARTDPNSGDISVAVSPRLAEMDGEEAVTWLRRMLAHEFHHSRRITIGPGFGATLGEWIVSEGLADIYVSELDPTFDPFAFRGFDQEAFEVGWRRAQPRLDDSGGRLDYRRWFAEDDDGQAGLGYSIGLAIVDRYLDAESSSAADSVAVPASRVLASYD